MVNRFMPGISVGNALVGRPIVRVDRFGVVGDVAVDEPMQFLASGPPTDFHSHITATLRRADQHRLIPAVSAASALRLTTNPSFVHFDDAAQNGVRGRERLADSLRQIPSGLERYVERPAKLAAGGYRVRPTGSRLVD